MSKIESQKLKDLLHIEESKPRIISRYKRTLWAKDGEKHRIYGPAVIGDGFISYYVNGKLHRTDGPAFESEDGYFEYSINGVNHRADGPAKFWQ